VAAQNAPKPGCGTTAFSNPCAASAAAASPAVPCAESIIGTPAGAATGHPRIGGSRALFGLPQYHESKN